MNPTTEQTASNLRDPAIMKLLLAVLVDRLGGGVIKVTQADIDGVAFNRIMEHFYPDGSIGLEVERRRAVS